MRHVHDHVMCDHVMCDHVTCDHVMCDHVISDGAVCCGGSKLTNISSLSNSLVKECSLHGLQRRPGCASIT